MTFSAAYWTLEMIILHFSLKEEYITEHTTWKVSCDDILICKRKIFLNILMPSVSCVHFKSIGRPLS